MTKKEIARCLGYTEEKISHYFDLAAKEHEGIAQKKGHYTCMKAMNYTLEECLFAMSFNPVWNPMMKQYLTENFIDRPGMYHDRTGTTKKLPRDAQDFIFCYNRRWWAYKSCNTCQYCVPRQMNKAGVSERPFCNFYNVFLTKVHINVYKDYCPTFVRTDAIPRLWEPGFPTNIDFYGNRTNTVLGIDRSEFISQREHKDDPIILLKN